MASQAGPARAPRPGSNANQRRLSERAAPRVCMFVYNNLLHDSRVRKEAATLAAAGYDVTAVAVHDPGRTQRREEVHGFRIVRVSRSILGVSRREIAAHLRRQPVTPMPSGLPARTQGRRRRAARTRAVLDKALRLPLFPLRRVVVFLRFLSAALKARGDIYHAHDLNTLLVAWAASRLRRTPLVYDTHEIATDRADMKLRLWACLLERLLIGRADRVVCTTQTRADFTQQRYGIAPPIVLRNLPAYTAPEPSDLLHRQLGLSPDTKVVLYQGGIQPERGLEVLLEAAQDMVCAHVVFLGSGRLKEALADRVLALGIGDKVSFHEAVPVQELPAWTACAYVGVQLLQNTCFNHYSSLSNKLLEYLMAGVPVIASDLPEMRRVIEDGEAGVLIDASSASAVGDAVNRLVENGHLREELAANARAARERYCWEREENVLLELYAELLADERPDSLAGNPPRES